MEFQAAVEFAFKNDWPLNIAVTVTWSALVQAGEHNEGHCLGRDERSRESYLRKELARCRPNPSVPFVAIWGRDMGATLGAHTHLSLYWPSQHLGQLVVVLERVTGSTAEFVRQPYTQDVVARSKCGGWQINMSCRGDMQESARTWAGYISEQHAKHPALPTIKGQAFGVSRAIGKTAREATGV